MKERERERGNETRSANREKPDCFFGATGKAKRCPLPSAKEDVWERERERELGQIALSELFWKSSKPRSMRLEDRTGEIDRE